MKEGHNHKTKLIIVNLFSELLCQEIGPNEKTIIEVVDCENFYVVKGKTSSKKIVDLNVIKESFKKKFGDFFENFEIGNTIDLVEYDCELSLPEILSLDFFNSQNLSALRCESTHTIKPLIIKSEFPYGYSNNMGKGSFLYCKHLGYNLQAKFNWDKIKINIPQNSLEDNFQIFIDVCDEPNEKMKSSILDAFDFNVSKFENVFQNKEWWKLLLEDDYELSEIKEINQDFIIF
jgi:hypothetical protein